MKTPKGFTLIEVMISISILSLLLFTGSYVYRTISNHWDRELGQFSASFEDARALNLLQNLVSGISPLVITNNEKTPTVPTVFFVGGTDSILGVSQVGVVNPMSPEVFRLTTVRSSEGKQDLVYQSVMLQKNLLLQTQDAVNFEHSFTLFKGMDSIEFRYFGWESFSAKNATSNLTSPAKKSWRTEYSGVDRQLLPEKIEIRIKKGERRAVFEVQLDQNSDKHLAHFFSQMDSA